MLEIRLIVHPAFPKKDVSTDTTSTVIAQTAQSLVSIHRDLASSVNAIQLNNIQLLTSPPMELLTQLLTLVFFDE